MDEQQIEDVCLEALGLADGESAAALAPEEMARFRDVACAVALAETPLRQPPTAVKDQLMQSLESYLSGDRIGQIFGGEGEACVVTDLEGRVQWINLAFTEMCGYRIEELRGQKPGGILQGPGTDREAAKQMSQAIRQEKYCSQEILNYHKNGQPYWASISISPILGPDRKARAFVALERIIDREVELAPA